MPGSQMEIPSQKGWASLPNAEDQKIDTFQGGSGGGGGQGRRRCIPVVLAVLVIALVAVVAAGVVSVQGSKNDSSNAVPAAPPSGDATIVDEPSFSDTTAADNADGQTTAQEPASEPAGTSSAEEDSSTNAAPAPVPEAEFGSTEPGDGSMAAFSLSMSGYSLSIDQSMSVPFSISFSGGSVDFSASFSLRRKERMLRKESAKKLRRTRRMTQRTAHN